MTRSGSATLQVEMKLSRVGELCYYIDRVQDLLDRYQSLAEKLEHYELAGCSAF